MQITGDCCRLPVTKTITSKLLLQQPRQHSATSWGMHIFPSRLEVPTGVADQSIGLCDWSLISFLWLYLDLPSLFTHKRLLKKISPELLVSYIWQPKYPPCIHPLMLVLIRISLVEDKPSSASSAKTYSTLLFDMKHRASNQLACQTDGITASNDSRNCFINGSQHGGNCVQVRLIDEERNPAKEEENKWQVSAMRWKQD